MFTESMEVMASNAHSRCRMPRLVIDDCPAEGNECLTKTTTLSLKPRSASRSLSLPNHDEAYKDLSGAIHYSSSKRLKNIFIRSHTYPNNYSSNEKAFYSLPLSTRISIGTDLLDPNNGIHSPAGSSSRYSLYGSFFDLSESGYHTPTLKTENRLSISDGCSLLTIDNSSRLSTNAYHDKCSAWLNHLETV